MRQPYHRRRYPRPRQTILAILFFVAILAFKPPVRQAFTHTGHLIEALQKGDRTQIRLEWKLIRLSFRGSALQKHRIK